MNDNYTSQDAFPAYKAISDLIHTYALNIRRARGPACVGLFTEDGVFEIRDEPLDGQGKAGVRARLEGRDAILRYLNHAEASGARVCPMIQNLIIDVDGDGARASSLMTTTIWPDGKRLIGEYEDHFVREGRWLFKSRIFRILGEFAS